MESYPQYVEHVCGKIFAAPATQKKWCTLFTTLKKCQNDHLYFCLSEFLFVKIAPKLFKDCEKIHNKNYKQ